MNPRPVTPVALAAGRLQTLLTRLPAAGPDPGWLQELRDVAELVAGLDPYLARMSTPESPALQALAESTRSHDWSGGERLLEQEMLSGHVEGQFLKMLVHATGARQVLEIGMFTGYSALAMAEALPAGGRVVACEIDLRAVELARESLDRTPTGRRVEIRTGPAAATLSALAAEGALFDLVFVDADKGGYLTYLDHLLTLDLLSSRALICVDNTLMQGEPWGRGPVSANGAAIEEFNRALAADPRVEQVLLPLRDGVTLVRRVPQP
ncbi:class I SAM-dependent methyltransferase [Kineosporia rhizophila]|uniref:class I SAM-dependent methyltransferase n=1 Tax=Kineosporia rhizophila TaxID=84633 RepID=UPI001E51F6B7|nr:class I SAM-dependent methyltransferase [Kineosporia rhizophila]